MISFDPWASPEEERQLHEQIERTARYAAFDNFPNPFFRDTSYPSEFEMIFSALMHTVRRSLNPH